MNTLFRLLLRAYPRAFRERFGREVVDQAVEDCARAFRRSGLAGWSAVAATAVDLVVAGVAERWDPAWRVDDNGRTETGVGMMIERILRDLRHAGRTLRRAPGFTAATVGTLALALGANAGIFSIVDAVLLEPLPYPEPDRLVTIAASAPGSDFPDEFPVSAEFFVHYGEEARQLESLASFNSFTATVRTDDRVERMRMSMPSMSLFETLGVEPELGRLPREGEGGRVALISHSLWETWFGSDPEVLGRMVWMVNGPKEVVGVMPADFRFPQDQMAGWVPTEMTAGDITPGQFGMSLVGRMTPDADVESLRDELAVLARRLPELYGGSPAYARLIEAHVPVVRSATEALLGPVRTALQVLMAAVAVVLLIACANVANLFTVRAESRTRDLAVQRAMGADRGRLVGGLLSEAVVVAVAAGLLAVLLAAVALPLYVAAAPDGVPRIEDVHLSGRTVAFTALAALATALICGLVPALRGANADLGRLRDGTRGSTSRRAWGRNALVVTQTALALVLLVGSGLLLRSVHGLQSVDPGFDRSDILTFQYAPDQDHLIDGPTWARFHLDMMDRLRALPGVDAVGIVENVPMDEGTRGVEYFAQDRAADAEGGARGSLTFAGGDYFQAMGIEVLQGRPFTDDDALEPGHVVVSRSLAEALWPGEDPVGRRLSNSALDAWHEVVGVVDDVVQNDLRSPPDALAYYPLVGPEVDSWALGSPGYVVRSRRADGLMPEIRGLIREAAPEAPIYRIHTMEALLDRSTVQLRFTMLTLAVAAGLALILGAVGLYGVLSYVVGQRTREIGVRMALGAEAGRVRRMVVRQGVGVVAVGIVLGLAIAFLATGALSSLLYEVAAVDPWTFGAMAAVMGAVGALASWVPALRASRVDPIESMRDG